VLFAKWESRVPIEPATQKVVRLLETPPFSRGSGSLLGAGVRPFRSTLSNIDSKFDFSGGGACAGNEGLWKPGDGLALFWGNGRGSVLYEKLGCCFHPGLYELEYGSLLGLGWKLLTYATFSTWEGANGFPT